MRGAMNSNIPFFSIIIPTNNRPEFLRDAVKSALNQTFRDFEIIVVDDNDREKSQYVVEEFKDSRIKYIINKRTKGAAGARNCGIFIAKGLWTAFLDDDDIWYPEKLQIQRNKIQNVKQSVGLIYSGYIICSFRNSNKQTKIIPEREGWIQNELFMENIIGTLSTVCIKTNLLKKIGGLDERFLANQDLELFIRVTKNAKVACIKKQLVYVRRGHSNRISLDIRKKLSANILLWEKYEKIINKNRLFRHRAASRVFIYAAISGNLNKMIETIPWTLIGLLVDFENFIWTARTTISLFYKKRFSENYKMFL